MTKMVYRESEDGHHGVVLLNEGEISIRDIDLRTVMNSDFVLGIEGQNNIVQFKNRLSTSKHSYERLLRTKIYTFKDVQAGITRCYIDNQFKIELLLTSESEESIVKKLMSVRNEKQRLYQNV